MKKEDLKNRINELTEELDIKLKTPKRTQSSRHDIEIAFLEGRISELKYLNLVWPDGMTVPNIIEQ